MMAARNWIVAEWRYRHVELSWRDVKRHRLVHRTFQDVSAVDIAFHETVTELNWERRINHPCGKRRMGLSRTSRRENHRESSAIPEAGCPRCRPFNAGV